MNRRDFFKGLLGAGAAATGIALFPGPEPAIMKVRPKCVFMNSSGTIKRRNGYVNYVPGVYLDLTNGLPR